MFLNVHIKKVSFLLIISKDLYYLLVFIEVISIYDYVSLNRDPNFEKKLICY